MTDNEIIKALDCCSTDVRENTCPKCAFYKKHRCSTLMLNAVFDLINRQKAENEELRNEIKFEAIKKFAERLKKEALIDSGFEVLQVGTIDNLVKEMTEESG